MQINNTFFCRQHRFIRTCGIAFGVYKIFGCIQLNTNRKVTKGAVAYINVSCIKDIIMQVFLNVDTACELY